MNLSYPNKNFLKKGLTAVTLMLGLSAQAQKFEINYIDCKLKPADLDHLYKIGKFEANFFNVVFNTTINDSLPVKINLYGKQSEYIKVQKQAMNTTFIDGFYSPGDNRLFLYKGDRYMEILQHETCHSLLNNNFRNPPQWLNEGIASLFGYLVIQNGQVFFDKQDFEIKVVKDLIYQGRFNLTSYFNNTTYNDWKDEQRRPYMYGVAYSLVYFFVKDDIDNLQNVLLLLKQGDTTMEALAKVFGSFEKFEKRFKDFYKPEVSYRM